MENNRTEDIKQDQAEFFNLMNRYNNVDRKIIKANLKRLMKEKEIKPNDIMLLFTKDFTINNVYAWTNKAANNIPLFDQAFNIATKFNFSVEEFLKEI